MRRRLLGRRSLVGLGTTAIFSFETWQHYRWIGLGIVSACWAILIVWLQLARRREHLRSRSDTAVLTEK